MLLSMALTPTALGGAGSLRAAGTVERKSRWVGGQAGEAVQKGTRNSEEDIAA